MRKICVLGAGSWGTALSTVLGKNEYRVALWGRAEDGVEQISSFQENRRFLPGVVVPDTVKPTADMEEAITGAEWVVLSVPSQAMRAVLVQAKQYLNPDTYVVNSAKGLEIATGMRMGQVAVDVLGPEISKRYAVLSGPSHAEEVGRAIPTAVTVASSCKQTASLAQDLFMSPSFRVYTNPDVAGVELGGALKNVIALATGVAYGLGYGDNTMAALMTRALTEIIRMGESLGGQTITFVGLSGLGDLVVTCGSRHSRNRRAGELIGQGLSLEQTLEQIGMVVEGASTCRIVHKMAMERDIEMPITRACYQVLYENRDPREAVLYLMQRQRKNESEDIGGFSTDWQ